MKIATWNVNGIRARGAEVVTFIEEEAPDVLCLQEIKAAPEQIEPETCPLPGYRTFWHGQKGGYSGVSLHIRDSLPEPKTYVPPFDMETRVLGAEIGDVHVLSVYAPNGGKDYDAKIAFYNAMNEWMKKELSAKKTLLVCGDLNIAHRDIDLHPSQRKPDVIGQRPEERVLFDTLLAAGFTDTGRVLHPEADRMFTWWPYWKAARQRNLGWRIDYILSSGKLKDKATSAEVKAKFGTSDHAPFVTVFET